MRPTSVTTVCIAILLLATSAARGEESGVEKAADAAKPADTAKTTDTATATATAAAEKDIFTLPPGFRVKKRGKHTVYCRKEEVMGTRFSSEKCYDKAGIREWKAQQVENQKQLDQMRRICGSQDACGGGG
jgi:hypothetical protein